MPGILPASGCERLAARVVRAGTIRPVDIDF